MWLWEDVSTAYLRCYLDQKPRPWIFNPFISKLCYVSGNCRFSRTLLCTFPLPFNISEIEVHLNKLCHVIVYLVAFCFLNDT